MGQFQSNVIKTIIIGGWVDGNLEKECQPQNQGAGKGFSEEIVSKGS